MANEKKKVHRALRHTLFVNYKIFRYGHWQIEEGGDDIIIDHNGNEQEWMHCYYTNAKGKMIAVYILNIAIGQKDI